MGIRFRSTFSRFEGRGVFAKIPHTVLEFERKYVERDVLTIHRGTLMNVTVH